MTSYIKSIIKKLRVELEYQENSIYIEVEPYRPIKYLKERATKLYYPLNFELKLIHANRDLTPFEHISLGDYFKNKGNINIKIFQIINFKGKISESDKISTERNTGSNSNSNPNNSNDNIINSKSNANNSHNSGSIPNNYKCSCCNDMISYFCRYCNSFICKSCRVNDLHKLHTSIHLDLDNMEESVKLYAITLQADISLSLKAGKKYQNNFLEDKFIDPSSRKEIIIRKLDEIERRQEAVIENLPQVGDNEINNILSNFDKQGLVAHHDIELIIEKIYSNFNKKNKKISFEQTEKYFNYMNKKEKELESVSKSVISYKHNYRVHKKIDDMYRIIENAIDSVLANEFNELPVNLIELDNSSMLTLDMISNIKKNIQTERESSDKTKKLCKDKTRNNENNQENKNKLSGKIDHLDGVDVDKKDSLANDFYIVEKATHNNLVENKRSQVGNRIVIEAIDKENKKRVQSQLNEPQENIDNDRIGIGIQQNEERSEQIKPIEENQNNIQELNII